MDTLTYCDSTEQEHVDVFDFRNRRFEIMAIRMKMKIKDRLTSLHPKYEKEDKEKEANVNSNYHTKHTYDNKYHIFRLEINRQKKQLKEKSWFVINDSTIQKTEVTFCMKKYAYTMRNYCLGICTIALWLYCI